MEKYDLISYYIAIFDRVWQWRDILRYNLNCLGSATRAVGQFFGEVRVHYKRVVSVFTTMQKISSDNGWTIKIPMYAFCFFLYNLRTEQRWSRLHWRIVPQCTELTVHSQKTISTNGLILQISMCVLLWVWHSVCFANLLIKLLYIQCVVCFIYYTISYSFNK